jgi:hypothetical protein
MAPRFAVECNNRTRDLISKPDRRPADKGDMLYLACASAFHWSKVGTPLHDARAEVTLAHAHALLGHGEMALHYAQRSLAFFESNAGEDWDIAFARAEVAHAAAVLGDTGLHARHYAAAKARGAAIAATKTGASLKRSSRASPSWKRALSRARASPFGHCVDPLSNDVSPGDRSSHLPVSRSTRV